MNVQQRKSISSDDSVSVYYSFIGNDTLLNDVAANCSTKENSETDSGDGNSTLELIGEPEKPRTIPQMSPLRALGNIMHLRYNSSTPTKMMTNENDVDLIRSLAHKNKKIVEANKENKTNKLIGDKSSTTSVGETSLKTNSQITANGNKNEPTALVEGNNEKTKENAAPEQLVIDEPDRSNVNSDSQEANGQLTKLLDELLTLRKKRSLEENAKEKLNELIEASQSKSPKPVHHDDTTGAAEDQLTAVKTNNYNAEKEITNNGTLKKTLEAEKSTNEFIMPEKEDISEIKIANQPLEDKGSSSSLLTRISTKKQTRASLANPISKITKQVKTLSQTVQSSSSSGIINMMDATKSSYAVNPPFAKPKIPAPVMKARSSLLPNTLKPRMSLLKPNIKTDKDRLSSARLSMIAEKNSIKPRKSCLPLMKLPISHGKASTNKMPAPPPRLTLRPTVPLFCCPACPANFRIKSLLDAHQQTHEIGLQTLSTSQKKQSVTSINKSNKCKYCDKQFELERTLNIHLMQHCSKIPASEKRKLQFTELNHVEKARLPTFHNHKLQTLQMPMQYSTAKQTGTQMRNGLQSALMPPPNSIKNTRISVAHSGVMRTPTKAILCGICKQSFAQNLDYTSHCLMMHPTKPAISERQDKQ